MLKTGAETSLRIPSINLTTYTDSLIVQYAYPTLQHCIEQITTPPTHYYSPMKRQPKIPQRTFGMAYTSIFAMVIASQSVSTKHY